MNQKKNFKSKGLKRSVLFLAIALGLLFLAACSKPTEPSPQPPTDQAEAGFATLSFEEQLMKIGDFIGVDDQQLTAAWAGGTEAKGEDGKLLLSRMYGLTDQADEHAATLMFTEDGKVDSVQIEFIAGKFEDWQKRFTEKLGEPKELKANTGETGDGNNAQSATWQTNGYEYRLQDAFGQTGLFITKLP